MTHLFSIRNSALFSAALLLILSVFACRKIVDNPTNNNNTVPFENSAMVNATITGQALDENGTPLVGALVSIGTHSFTTGANGAFYFKNISAAKNATLITVTKAGYFHAYRTLSLEAGKDHYTRIRAMKMDNIQSFTTTSDASINVDGGAKVNIPKGSVYNPFNGAPYNGVVKIAAQTIRAGDAAIAELTPGALRGIASSGAENALETYGMIAVEMTDASGNALNIAPGKTAEIRMPIEASQVAAAPASIPLWHFDPARAMWVEEGSAQKIGNEYVGTVKHFSYWNCDYGGAVCQFNATFQDTNGAPLSNVQISLQSSNNGTRSAWTNSNGYVSGALPVNSSFTLSVTDVCGGAAYTTTFSVTTANISLGILSIILPTATGASISGTAVDCQNNPIPNAIVYVSTPGAYVSVLTANASGVFSMATNICSANVPYTFTAFDPVANVNGSVTANINVGSNPVGNVYACGTLNQFWNYTIVDANGTKTFSHNEPIETFSSSYSAPTTYINSYGTASGGGTTSYKSVSIGFDGNGTTGLHNITSFSHGSYSQAGGQYYVSSDSNATITVPINVTSYAPASGGFIEGNYNGSFSTTSPVATYTITGNFRAKRNF